MNRLMNGMTGFVIRRILLGVVVLGLASILVFSATQALGDPARAILGRAANDPGRLAALQKELNLSGSPLQQYFDWVRELLGGSLGNSLATQQPVSELLQDRLINSVVLMACAAAISIPVAVAFGSWAALRRDGLFDKVGSNVMLTFNALPEFVVALLLVILLATTVFHWLPPVSLLSPGTRPWDDVTILVMPTATLIFAVTPYVSRIMRSSMVEVLESDYVEMARLKGLPERTMLFRHALPNAVGPVFQVIAISLAYLAGGVVIVEYVFNYPGIGSALVDAVGNHDLPVIQALAMLIAAVYVLLNLLADVGTILVTPRLRTRL